MASSSRGARERTPLAARSDRLAVVYATGPVDPLDLSELGMPTIFVGDRHLPQNASGGLRSVSEALPWLQWVADVYDQLSSLPYQYIVFRHVGRQDWHRFSPLPQSIVTQDQWRASRDARVLRVARPPCVQMASPVTFGRFGSPSPYGINATWVPTGLPEVRALDELARSLELRPWRWPSAPPPAHSARTRVNGKAGASEEKSERHLARRHEKDRLASNWNAHVAGNGISMIAFKRSSVSLCFLCSQW